MYQRSLLLLLAASVIPAGATEPIDLSRSIAENHIIPTGIYWTFDEGTTDSSRPTSVSDHSGNQYHGELRADEEGRCLPTYAPGKFGQALVLRKEIKGQKRGPSVYWDGRSAADNSRLDMAEGGFTAGAWIRLEAKKEGEPEVISVLERGRSAAKTNFFSFQLRKTAAENWTLNLLLPGEGNIIASSPTKELNATGWHHVAVSLDPEAEQGGVTFWLNGKPLGPGKDVTGAIAPTANAAERQFSAGERNVANYYTSFNGLMDDLFVTSGVYRFTPAP